MADRDAKSPLLLGFLTVVAHEQHGLFGGYLLLNAQGRPLEFHCTAPLKPNRAQEILFGPTLTPYLYGEQIGQTLITKAATQPAMVCTNLAEVMAVRSHVDLPVGLVLPSGTSCDSDTIAEDSNTVASGSDGPMYRVDNAHRQPYRLATFTWRERQLATAEEFVDDPARIAACLESLHHGFDLSEPFARISEAIEEAQRSGR